MNIQISMTQAAQIASTVWADIADYIEAHREEFEQFVSGENGGDEK